MSDTEYEIDAHILADMEGSVHEMSALMTISDVSQAITDRLNNFKEQHTAHETTYEDLSLLAEAAVGLEILRQFPVSGEDTYEHKQNALMVHADNVGGYLSSVLVHKDETGIPEAKIIYDRLVAHGMDAVADIAAQEPGDALEI